MDSNLYTDVVLWEISWTKPETLFVNIQGNVTNAKCNTTSPYILVSVMVPYTFAKTIIFIASLQIIQNWNVPLIWSNYLSLSFTILIYESI